MLLSLSSLINRSVRTRCRTVTETQPGYAGDVTESSPISPSRHSYIRRIANAALLSIVRAMDITSALAGPSRVSTKRKRDAGDAGDDDDAFIAEKMSQKEQSDGADLLRKRKGNNKNSNSFQSLGLSAALLKTLLQRGFNAPTPIQRLAMPAILSSRDVVGMARTGSGKTLAYLVPLIQRLNARHSPTFGCRSLILVPTRELALQVLKVGKDLARGARDGEGEGLRWGLIVGGEGMDDQFEMLTSNPDVIIATPGRLLHLVVEMNLDFRSVSYVVFDEADRLFEMGFETQLHEVLHRLPPTRQTLLFSATLPKSLVEFAKAGLQNPKLVRLDAESKISPDLRMAFLSVKPTEKEAALLCLLRDVIGVPQGKAIDADRGWEERKAKGKGKKQQTDREEDYVAQKEMAPHQTLIFAATKHHVEYLSALLAAAGYSVAQIYGTMDHSARQLQLGSFRAGRSSVLVVTDLAARGIDIPVLENVVNYDFPVGARTYVHRVGRTARAGRKGWAYSFVTNVELAHLIDLQLFLSRPLKLCPIQQIDPNERIDYANNLILGTLPRDRVDGESEHVRSVLVEPSPTITALQAVAVRGQKMYERSSAKASTESHRRAKALVQAGQGLAGSILEDGAVHPVFASSTTSVDAARTTLLASVKAFRPQETVFEVGVRGKGKSEAATVMQKRRETMAVKHANKARAEAAAAAQAEAEPVPEIELASMPLADVDMSDAEEDDIEVEKPSAGESSFRDPAFYMGYEQAGAAAEKGYALNDATSFTAQAAKASFSLNNDEEGRDLAPQRASTLRWDRKNKRVVKGDGGGSDNKKLIKTENGTRLPASFRSGAFNDWKQKSRQKLPRVGEAEAVHSKNRFHQNAAKHSRHQGGDGERSGGKKDRSSLSEKAAGKSRAGKGRKLLDGGKLRSIDQMAKGAFGYVVLLTHTERQLKENRVRRSTQPGKKRKGKR